MTEAKKKNHPILAVICLVVCILFLIFLFGGGIEKRVVSESIKQYEITKRSGNSMEVCVHAGMVAAGYLQAKDENGYKKWKQIEFQDCANAGIPSN